MSEPVMREDVPELEWVAIFRVVTERPSRMTRALRHGRSALSSYACHSDKFLDIEGAKLLWESNPPVCVANSEVILVKFLRKET